jgi:hypothetical protein
MFTRDAFKTYNRILAIIRLAKRAVISHQRLREGHQFKPRFYPKGLACQKKVRRALLGLPPSRQGKAPKSKAFRMVERRRRLAA